MKKYESTKKMDYRQNNATQENLNKLVIDNETFEGQSLNDPSTFVGDTHVYFRNLESHLIHYISESDAVLGCVAWLTSFTILDALAKKHTSIIVQKEDFLRPDMNASGTWKYDLREKYNKLKCWIDRNELTDGYIYGINADQSISPIRCVGNHNKDRKPAFPRMHNKFLIFCKVKETRHICNGHIDFLERKIVPYAVWTGSFNLTLNATNSLENAVVLRQDEFVNAYYEEWKQILGLSEGLDWEADWCAPEYRIGT